MPFSVYLIEGPGGKQYVGVSKNPKRRWHNHLWRAKSDPSSHPLYNAFRKHGAGAFRLSTIAEFDRLEDALAYEVFEIAARRLNDRRKGYNVSRGGDYDRPDGLRLFWAGIRRDPDRMAAYLSRQRAAGLATWAGASDEKKARHSEASVRSATNTWVSRTDSERTEVAAKISESVKALSLDPAYRERNLAGLEKGRKNMDRAVQGKAASTGLKQFWIDLRADPQRYDEYINRRRKTLLATLSNK